MCRACRGGVWGPFSRSRWWCALDAEEEAILARRRCTFPALAALLLVSTPVSVVGLAAAQTAHTDRIQIYSMDTLTLTEQQFLTGAKDGKSSTIGGELRLPPGSGRFPAVVLMPASGGVGANVNDWADELNSIGVAAFIVDSFTGRAIHDTVRELGHFAMIVDAYRALDLLSKHPRIDSSRIAVMGFSKGAAVALYASMKRFQKMWAPSNAEFSAYIPFYAPCGTPLIDDEQVSDRPIRLFHGLADDFVPAAPCQQYVERLRRAGKDVQITIYDGARHLFDYPPALLVPVKNKPDTETPFHCRRAERPEGVIMNLDTGKPWSWSDACVTRGVTIGADPHAREQSIKAVNEFLTNTWKLEQVSTLPSGPPRR